MTIRLDTADGLVRLTLDNPPLNILTRNELAELRESVRCAGSDPRVRAVVLLAAGKHFCAGADVAEHLPPTHERMIPEFVQTIETLLDCPIPMVAGVRGRCLGGGFEVVQGVDVVIAGAGAQFGQPEIALGVLPPVACALLPTLAAPGVAAEVVLTGDPLTAVEAERSGLVRRVVPDDQVDAEAASLAGRMARHSRAALVVTKRALVAGRRAALDTALAAARTLYLGDLMETADALEGLRAFQEKRPPVWSHR
ncbi:MAG TPA: enoyl-CoA hydratase-related protein [Gemmatimonadales bacterium]